MTVVGRGRETRTTTTSTTTSSSSSNNSSSSSAARRQQQRDLDRDQLQAALPAYLTPYVFPRHGDYCYSRVFHPKFIAQLMAEGFLPVASEGALLPKLHRERCVIPLPHALHVSKSVRKRSKKYHLILNGSLEAVIQGCHRQHGVLCWLYPRLVRSLKVMFAEGVMQAHAANGKQGQNLAISWPVRLYTVEIYNTESGDLAGGELGYTVGSIYTSLTGFTQESGAGSVQMAALGRLLIQRGFTLWDLGMDMEYKRELGATLMVRKQFLQHVHAVREAHGHLVLPVRERLNCRTIMDASIPQESSNK